jgi:hypothetical protein
MAQLEFELAMHNHMRLAPYDRPDQMGTPAYEWLIVQRFGEGGRFLTISEAGDAEQTAPRHAPPELRAIHSILGILTDEVHTSSKSWHARFLLSRTHHRSAPVPAAFFPSEGIACLQWLDGTMTLDAVGRHFHTRGKFGNAVILNDVACPAPGAQGGKSWHFAAQRVAWLNETL